MDALLKAILFSILPVSELRGGIPIAVSGGMSIYTAYAACVIANILVIPFVYLFLETLHHAMYSMPWYRKIADNFLERTRKRVHKKVEKYGYFGLFIFTAIPLPITGAYTATVGAWFLGMKKIKSFIAIAAGVICAGIIVSAVVVLGIEALKIFVKMNGG